MSGFGSTTFGVMRRHLRKVLKNPELSTPPIVMPLFFLIAFAGGLSAVADAPGFDYPGDYTAFIFVFVLLQAAAFSGVFTASALADDFELKFSRRLLLNARARNAILAGYTLAAAVQAFVVGIILFVIAYVFGMDVSSNPIELLTLAALAVLLAIAVTLFELGLACRFRTSQATPAMQMPIFIATFLTPLYTTRDNLEGWLQTAADYNPLTPLLESGRALLIGSTEDVGLAFASGVGMAVVFGAYALISLRKAAATP